MGRGPDDTRLRPSGRPPAGHSARKSLRQPLFAAEIEWPKACDRPSHGGMIMSKILIGTMAIFAMAGAAACNSAAPASKPSVEKAARIVYVDPNTKKEYAMPEMTEKTKLVRPAEIPPAAADCSSCTTLLVLCAMGCGLSSVPTDQQCACEESCTKNNEWCSENCKYPACNN
jgi:hypothetical protein